MKGLVDTHSALWNVGKCSEECSLVRLRPARPEECGEGHTQYQSEPHFSLYFLQLECLVNNSRPKLIQRIESQTRDRREREI